MSRIQYFLSFVLSVSLATVSNASLQVNDANYLGSYVPGKPVGESFEAHHVNILNQLKMADSPLTTDIVNGKDNTYSRSGSTLGDGPFPLAVFGEKDDAPLSASTTVSSTYHYVVGKYGVGNGGGSLVWYSADGFTGLTELPSTFPVSGTGLSHISFLTAVAVPEPTSILAWSVVLGAIGIVAYRSHDESRLAV